MKRMILCILALCTIGTAAPLYAQQKGATKKAATTNTKTKKASGKKAPAMRKGADTASVQSLQSASSNEAYAPERLQISDPTVRTLNARAAGEPVRIGSGIIGAPKGTYGFANGHITLYMQGATSTGTTTGSGSVGTGTSPGAVGTIGPGMGVNGKSPYAEPGPYGNRITDHNQVLVIPDSASRVRNGKN